MQNIGPFNANILIFAALYATFYCFCEKFVFAVEYLFPSYREKVAKSVSEKEFEYCLDKLTCIYETAAYLIIFYGYFMLMSSCCLDRATTDIPSV